MYKRAYHIGIIAYLATLILALLFYKERTIFTDASFYLFHIIKNNDFCIQIFRFGNVITQSPAVVARHAGASLNVILESYSLAYAAYYFISYLVCGLVMKRYETALAILLLNLLFVTDTFYWMPSEMPMGIAMLLLILAYVRNLGGRAASPAGAALVVAAMITIVFFHPLIIFVVAYCALFFWDDAARAISRKHLVVIAGMYASVLLAKMVAFKSPYEQHSLSGMKNFITHFPNYVTLYSNKRFLVNCVTKYFWIPLSFAGITAYYTRSKQWRRLALFAGASLGYLALVNISYPDTVTPDFYIENLYTPLAIFMALPLLFDVLPCWRQGRFITPVITLVAITGIIRVYAGHKPYTARLDYERKALAAYGDQKWILNGSKPEADVLLMKWGTGYEMLLLSEIERNRPASIVIDDSARKFADAVHQNKVMIVNWDVFPYAELPTRYFQFTDTFSYYRVEY